MLDPASRLTLPGLEGLVIYGDDASSHGFYALPVAPRLAADEAGRLQLGLTVYGHHERGRFAPRGGLLVLTTSLGLTAAEDRAVRAALAKRLGSTPSARKPLPQADILAPDWIAGSVEVVLAPGVRLDGSPSLYGANHCSFNVKLGPSEVASLLEHWRRRPSDTRVRYRLTARTGSSKRSVRMRVQQSRLDAGGLRSEHRIVDADTETSAPGSYVLEFEGPLVDPRFDLESVVNRISM